MRLIDQDDGKILFAYGQMLPANDQMLPANKDQMLPANKDQMLPAKNRTLKHSAGGSGGAELLSKF